MKPRRGARTHGGSLRRVLVRTAVLIGSAAAFWLLPAASASAFDASRVEDALETGVETVEDVAAEVSGSAHRAVEAVDRAAPVRQVPRAAVGVVHTSTAAIADAVAGVGHAGEATGAGRDGLANPADDAREEGRIVRRDGHLRSLRSTTPAAVGGASTRLAPSRGAEAGPRVLPTAGELHRAADRSARVPCPAGETRSTSAGFDDLSGFLAALTIVLGSGRWSRSAAEVRITPAFLSLTERPG